MHNYYNFCRKIYIIILLYLYKFIFFASIINDVNGSLSNPENLKLILYFPFLYVCIRLFFFIKFVVQIIIFLTLSINMTRNSKNLELNYRRIFF